MTDTNFIRPIDPDISQDTNSMSLDMNWYQKPKLPGFSFMIRAKNEASNIATCLLSIQKHLSQDIPYQLVVINNDSQDYTPIIAQNLLDTTQGDKVVDYPYKIAKPGLENYYTPLDSVHSFVYFTQFCLMQCDHEWIFRWDADFEMTPKLGQWMKSFWDDHLNKQKWNAKTFDYVMLPATDQDGIINSEMYMFHTNTDPYFYRRSIWEQVGFLKINHPPFMYHPASEQALILHQSTLKVIKSSYLEEPWWTTKLKQLTTQPDLYPQTYIDLMNTIEQQCQEFIAKLPSGAQTFCRSMDPKPIELVKLLPFDEAHSKVHEALCQLRHKDD